MKTEIKKQITFTFTNNLVEIQFNGIKADPRLYANLQPVKETIRRLFEEHAHRERSDEFNHLTPAKNKLQNKKY